MSAVITRFLFVGVTLLLSTSVVFGDGSYQRTKNGKTIVWNNNAKPGDEAIWWGDRDREGYATGFGTLSWYSTRQQQNGHTKSVLYARYYGRTVRGKFDGPVNVHSNGKTDHAIFVDGQRTTRWIAGRTPSWRVAQQPTEPARPKRTVERASAKRSGAAEPEAPAEGPPPVQGSASGPEGPAPRREVGDQITDRPTAQTVGKSARPSLRAGLGVDVNRPTDRAVAKPATNKGPKDEVDGSLRELVGPPSSLERGPIVDAPSAGAKTVAASSPGAKARLKREEVIDLADAEARTRGYDLTEYQRPEPQYKPADETWSLFYDQMPDANGMYEIGKHFRVTVDDKTKKASIIPGR
jgi:hypothetical protein